MWPCNGLVPVQVNPCLSPKESWDRLQQMPVILDRTKWVWMMNGFHPVLHFGKAWPYWKDMLPIAMVISTRLCWLSYKLVPECACLSDTGMMIRVNKEIKVQLFVKIVVYAHFCNQRPFVFALSPGLTEKKTKNKNSENKSCCIQNWMIFENRLKAFYQNSLHTISCDCCVKW